ncbi:hypothetical protein M9Y10_009574 [Tritrichomonas musculus]|uniref:Uncharacterized protein n=1 Tax=Tritrichomonas musculus TaxID=1915356 RepID=A0ABR2INQ3_9EUKA
MLGETYRPMTSVEQWFFNSQMNTHIGFEFERPDFIPTAVQRLKERILGLHLRCENGMIISTNNPIEVNDLPKECNTAGKATRWVIDNKMPNPTERLATISAGNSCIVMSMNHMIADGTLLLQTIHNIAHDFKPILPKLPIAPDITFEKDIKELMKSEKFKSTLYDSSKYTRLYPKYSENLQNQNSNNSKHHPVDTIEYRVPISEMQCYNREKDNVHNLTEALLNSLLLSAVAYNGRWTGPLVAYSCVNLRQYLTKEQIRNPGICCHFSDVTVEADAPLHATVGELTKQFKYTLKERIKQKECLVHIGDLAPQPKTGLQFELSNVGQVTWKSPVKNVYFQVGCGKFGRPMTMDLFCHSMIVDSFNNVEMKLQFPTDQISWKEADLIGRSVGFGLRSISDKMTIKEAIDAFEGYQKLLRKA